MLDCFFFLHVVLFARVNVGNERGDIMKNYIKALAIAGLVVVASSAMASEQCVNSTHVADGVWASKSTIKNDLKLDLVTVGTTPVTPAPGADPNYPGKYDCAYTVTLEFAQGFPVDTSDLLPELVNSVHYAAVPGQAWAASCAPSGACQINFRNDK